MPGGPLPYTHALERHRSPSGCPVAAPPSRSATQQPAPLAVAEPHNLLLFPRRTSACATASCDDSDLSNRDLRKEFYTKGSLKRANFAGSNLAGVTLFGADLSEANFTGADLQNADLGQCNMTGAVLKGARAHADSAGARWAHAGRCVCRLMALTSCSAAADANLAGAIVSSARFEGAVVDGADFTARTLSGPVCIWQSFLYLACAG